MMASGNKSLHGIRGFRCAPGASQILKHQALCSMMKLQTPNESCIFCKLHFGISRQTQNACSSIKHVSNSSVTS